MNAATIGSSRSRNRTAAPPADATTSALRGFSRFYTRRLGLFGAGLQGSRFTLTQARVLYELAHRGPLVAGDLVRELALDPGYLSRILKAFERDGLIERSPVPADRRRVDIRLTRDGRTAQTALERRSEAQAAELVAPLDPAGRARLRDALARVERLLDSGDVAGAGPDAGSSAGASSGSIADTTPGAVELRPHRPGDMGWVVHRHGVLYATEYGWDARFEAMVAEIGAAMLRAFDPASERGFIAERDGRILGAAFAVRESATTMKIRLVYVEPEARGLGIGRQLTAACIAFAREKEYQRVTLWTNSILTAARHIYASAGFRKVAEAPYDDFGATGLVGESWELDLLAAVPVPAIAPMVAPMQRSPASRSPASTPRRRQKRSSGPR